MFSFTLFPCGCGLWLARLGFVPYVQVAILNLSQPLLNSTKVLLDIGPTQQKANTLVHATNHTSFNVLSSINSYCIALTFHGSNILQIAGFKTSIWF